MTREDYIDEFIRHGSDLIPYNTPNYDEVLLERANKYADEMLNPDSKLGKLCEWHDSLIDNHSSDVEEQEDKQLLLRDLCARLPYHDLWVRYDNKDWLAIGYGHERIELLPNIFSSIAGPCPLIDEIKPYLRPMSSMTKEERRYLLEELGFDEDLENWELNDFGSYVYPSVNALPLFDWLNENKFDYRGLIPMGLALEAPEDMYKTE